MKRSLIAVISYFCTISAQEIQATVMCTDKLMIIASSPKRFRNFSYELDLRERRQRGEGLDLVGGGDYVMIKSEELKQIKFKTRQYDHVKSIMDETEETQSEFVQSRGKKRQLWGILQMLLKGRRNVKSAIKNSKQQDHIKNILIPSTGTL